MLTLIKNAHVFAPEDRGIVHLLVGAGRILWMGADLAEFGTMAAASTVDLEGRRLIPGIIDGHAHVTGGGGEAGFATRIPPVPIERFILAGVTGVVGVLGTDDTTRDTRSLVAQTLSLREQGMGAWCHTGGYHVPPVTFTGSVRDDIVFIDPIIGVGELALSDHRSSQPTLEELLRIASDVYVAGMIGAKAGIVHLHMGDGARGLDLVRRALETSELPARVFNPTHVNRRTSLFDEALELARKGCTIDITAYPDAEKGDGYGAADALQRYLGSGAPAARVTLSSDGGGCLPNFDAEGVMLDWDVGNPASLTDTLRTVLNDGVDLAEVLPAFTANVADLLRLRNRGRIAAGMIADLVVLDAAHGVSDVMLAGKWRLRDGVMS
ncbi:MAG: beta-aspartyl-peptidase [Gammaproteobacteria bacterium]